MSARHSRWSDEPRRDSAGKPIPIRFGENDLEVCKLLASSTVCRAPWSYQYLPSTYIPAILQRGDALKRRLDWLTDEPNWYVQRPVQPLGLQPWLMGPPSPKLWRACFALALLGEAWACQP